MASNKPREEIWDEWNALVNMTRTELRRWLDSEQSQAVGADAGDGESTGHKSGRRIIDILGTNKGDLTGDDWDHMARVVGYAKRHLAQGGPQEDVEHSAWRYSLMNWGHDPCKD